MPDISFTSFNPRSFEQFAQALASEILGRGLLVFGDGPDGGREASFDGEVPYPSPADRWSGRIVVQAKFHLHSSRDGKDATWLAAQIAGEASKLTASKQIPDYYLIITNVRLSGVAGRERKGGQQKMDEAFAAHLEPLGVKAMHVWHEEKIATLLDGQPDLLRSYGAWLSPREVLAAVFASLSDRVPDFEATMLRLLMREFREQRATRLQQAGHVDDAATPLESVFVDLPYGASMERIERRMELLGDLRPSGGPGGLLGDLLALVSLKLDPVSVARAFPEGHEPAPVRHLVLGGPGQGKSTISQFLAQVARARLLHDQPRERLTAEVGPVLDAVRRRMTEIGIPIDGPRRYPLRVDLPTFADALSRAEKEERSLSLLDFLAARISSAANTAVDTAIMRRWLKDYPWLLILDGLDEVPPSGNRGRLLEAITGFWDEATPVNADVAMIVTTRPQGYNDDLDPRTHMRHEMQKLTPDRALVYARGVATLKIHEEERRERVLARLQAAAENPTTALLMVSPLQVAILLQLVDQRGSAPTDRWTLFAEYLSVVIKREQEKQGEAGRVVKERAFVIDGMLRRAGLLLQVEAERQGGAQAFLSLERLHELARETLSEDGHDDDVLEGYAAEIVAAATDRLVFLEQRVEGQVEFEVRSLQEFMAAAELMGGDDAQVQERLRAIAGRNHWQHVYRIAASKAFSSRDAAKYRDTVIAANLMLESGDASGRATRRGGALALELLADGVAHDQPKFRRGLLEQAAALMELGPGSLDARLPEVLTMGGVDEGLALLAPRLTSTGDHERLASWELLFKLIREPHDPADRLAMANWPADETRRLDIAAGPVQPRPDASEAASLVIKAFLDAGPVAATAALRRAVRPPSDKLSPQLAARAPFLTSLAGGAEALQLDVGLLESTKPTMRLRLVTIGGARAAGTFSFPDHPAWHPLMPMTAFVEDPSTERFAAFVQSLGDPLVIEAATNISLPWMLGTALSLVRAGRDAEELAAAIRAGDLGEPDDWSGAEKRWHSGGISLADVELWRRGSFFGPDVAVVGAPYAHYLSMTMNTDDDRTWLDDLIAALLGAEEAAPASFMRRILFFALGNTLPTSKLSADKFVRVYAPVLDQRHRAQAEIVDAISSDALTDYAVVDLLARIGDSNGYTLAADDSPFSVGDAVALARRTPEPGLLRLGASLFATRPRQLREFAIALALDLGNLQPGDEPASITVLLHLAGLATLADALSAATALGRLSVAQHALLALANDSSTTEAEAEDILVTLITRLGLAASRVRGEALAALRRMLDQRTSELEDIGTWTSLGLPQALHRMIRTGSAGG